MTKKRPQPAAPPPPKFQEGQSVHMIHREGGIQTSLPAKVSNVHTHWTSKEPCYHLDVNYGKSEGIHPALHVPESQIQE